MKCPKCSYLGFDTGERCRNCGYDFSLITIDDAAADLPLRMDVDDDLSQRAVEADLQVRTVKADPQVGLTRQRTVDVGLNAARPVAATSPAMAVAPATAVATALEFEPAQPPPSFRGEPGLPLFGASAVDDEPLIKVPSPPRPPLAVRRTPDLPRLRAVPRPVERPLEPALDFADQPVTPAPVATVTAPARQTTPEHLESSGGARRVLAAAIDHGILLAIDAVVVYLTLRIAALTMSDWRAVPLLPMLTFLGLLKLSYFTAFTCVGGQTIGKMATNIRVVGEDDRPLDAPHAIHRALAGAVSFLILGAGFVPVLFGSDRRALHDRLAHTRVVSLPTA